MATSARRSRRSWRPDATTIEEAGRPSAQVGEVPLLLAGPCELQGAEHLGALELRLPRTDVEGDAVRIDRRQLDAARRNRLLDRPHRAPDALAHELLVLGEPQGSGEVEGGDLRARRARKPRSVEPAQ